MFYDDPTLVKEKDHYLQNNIVKNLPYEMIY